MEARIDDVLKAQDRIDTRVENYLDRLARIEANYEHLRKNLKDEVMADVGRELTKAQVYLDLQARGLLPDGKRGQVPILPN